jgi:hypothetical protein
MARAISGLALLYPAPQTARENADQQAAEEAR